MVLALTISVVVPSRNRPDAAAECVDSVLALRECSQLIVVDQSDGTETHDALEERVADARLQYISSPTRCVSAARNAGIAASRGQVIAFTDDDCRVSADWLTRLAAIFEGDPTVAAVCGRVRVPKGSVAIGYAAEFEPRQREYVGRLPPAGEDWGLSANFAIRRDVLDRVGRFDVLLGAGAPLRSGEDYDLVFRVLRAGLKVVNAAEVEVLHLGVRPYGRRTRELWFGYGIGVGAAFFKHVRLGDPEGLRLYVRWLLRCVHWILHGFVLRRRLTGVRFTLGFLRGTVMSLRYGVDGANRLYVRRGQQPLSPHRLAS